MTTTIPTPNTLADDTLATSSARLRALGAALNGAFVERNREIAMILVALIAGEHVLLLGDPGTGKSALTSAVCTAIGGSFFQLLLTRFTLPEEVFGPMSLAGLERDEYRRITKGYAADSSVVFLDEVFKANSSILNALLTLLNERMFDNGGARVRCPLDLTIAASNELPEDDTLAALYDRFVVRAWVAPVRDRDALRRLLRSRGEPSISATLSPDDLAVMRAAVDRVVVPDDVLDVVLDLRDALAQEHGITASDRRWRKCEKLIRACAALDGRLVATRDDVMILASSLWRTPDEIAKVHGTIARLACPDLAAAMKVYDAANEAFGRVNLADAKTGIPALAELNTALHAMVADLRKLDLSGGVGDLLARVEGMQVAVGAHIARRLTLPKR